MNGLSVIAFLLVDTGFAGRRGREIEGVDVDVDSGICVEVGSG